MRRIGGIGGWGTRVPGRMAAQGVIAGAVEYTRDFLAALSEEEQKLLQALLLKASHNLGFDWLSGKIVENRKLLLVNPVNPARTGLTVNKSSRFPPIGLGIVAALTPAHWSVSLVDENWEPFAYQDADLVGEITAFTASANRAYQLATIYRERGTSVVMGGIHASMCSEEALRFVDSVVVGEAETVWPQVVADFEKGRLQQILPRRVGRSGGITASTPRSVPSRLYVRFCANFPRLPNGLRVLLGHRLFNGRRYRRRPSEEVLDELAAIPQKMIFFVDDNIIGYGGKSREQALAIFRGMVERKLNKWWFCQASINFADDDELLAWAGRAGCKMVFLRLEAEVSDALREVNKVLNLQRGVWKLTRGLFAASIAQESPSWEPSFRNG